MKRHIPTEVTCHGDEECVVCGATRDVISVREWPPEKRRYSRWILYGRFEPYCPGKEKKRD